MKKYILIQNDGEIETNSFELIGASTKRNDSGKIGFFGSGLKYSIAYMMRKEIDFKVYSGLAELSFTTKDETLKDQTFQRICINGNPTSYTVTMGPTWKEDWFVLREIYCNALDESNCQIIKETEIVQPSEGKTRIYIEATEDLTKVINNWDAYFSDDREPIFTSSNVYTSALGNEEISGATTDQQISVFNKTKGVLFRKGVRVYSDDKLMYDYGASAVNINEDRTAKTIYGLGYTMCSLVAKFDNQNYVESVLRTGQDEKPSREYNSLSDLSASTKFSSLWVDFSKEKLLVVAEKSGKYAEEIQKSRKEMLFVPHAFAKRLKKEQPDCIILGMGKQVGNSNVEEVEMSSKMKFLLQEVTNSLLEMNYRIDFDVKVVHFDEDNVMGRADIGNKIILIAASTFDMGRREIALTLMEENEHIKSGKEDETRAFQTHIFSQWLKSMEESNGLFL